MPSSVGRKRWPEARSPTAAPSSFTSLPASSSAISSARRTTSPGSGALSAMTAAGVPASTRGAGTPGRLPSGILRTQNSEGSAACTASSVSLPGGTGMSR